MHNRKGVILCGGQGTRLRPATLTTNKHLLPIVNEPMILYPIRTLKEADITDILIVTGGEHIGAFADFLGDGSDYGVNLTYRVQKHAGGIAQALSLARDYWAGDNLNKVVAILGDNIFEPGFGQKINHAINIIHTNDAAVFLKKVDDPRCFGVARLSPTREYPARVIGVVEKPQNPAPDGYAVTGCYIYPPSVFDIIDNLKPSLRGELEITDVTNHYVEWGYCRGLIYNGFWSDAGTPESLLEVSNWAFKKHLT
jgi:glucose-1-phosphate thymidylyltransferase